MRKVLILAATSAVLLTACQKAEQKPVAQGGCEPGSLNLVTPGQLTVGTDNPAYPPWFEGGEQPGSPFKINDPATGKGFESAVAYAVAERLGFAKTDLEWVEVPFNQSFKPGPKDFDFDINQISFKPPRDEAVDFSDSYYDVNQALVALGGTDIANAGSLAELKAFKLGAPIGTTSYDYIADNIQPDQDPAVFDTLNDAISALKNGQIDGVVVDLPTAFYVTAVQVPKGVIVGQFATVGQQEYFGMVFEEGNPLVDCVNRALDELRSDGTLQDIQDRWLSQNVDVPVLS